MSEPQIITAELFEEPNISTIAKHPWTVKIFPGDIRGDIRQSESSIYPGVATFRERSSENINT